MADLDVDELVLFPDRPDLAAGPRVRTVVVSEHTRTIRPRKTRRQRQAEELAEIKRLAEYGLRKARRKLG